ncbi:MarR family transcriptional regulator [Lactobacillus crispatus]|uniref:Helix-turn-helix domain-containing protein n=1 Tax=Lactobacillus crispatus TaxID=47770 RepID=A0AAW8WIU8_9LACO|nr:helix-turn-helix domain-containing protein [Lactobacillus crispatus]MDK6665183.1 helix-turn-helix domain-containing protein [Lactobacillus crispatus]MDT9609369.1 helix-turn-helix domain-containing protein [Lactobacillus crispatus]MDT9617026.1 helix-turn-helix domain-containing protein [Lactobacillus crispatus]
MTKKRKTSEANHKFKGVWIPAEYWLDKDLTIMEVALITEIDSLDGENGCFASNKLFADFLGITPGRVSQLVKSLKEKGYITTIYSTKNNVTQRTIRVVSKLNTPVKKLNRGIKNTKGVFNKLLTSNISSNTFNSNTVSNSSSAKKEEDPEREKIYKEFFTIARMNDKLKNHSTNPTLDELKQLRGLLYQCNVDTLQAVKDKFKERMSWDMVGKPYSYLLKMLRDGLANDRNYESWG